MRGILFSLCALALSVGAHAQPFPQPGRTVRIIVPFGPGGATDVQARAIAQKLAASIGVPVGYETGGMPPADFARLVRSLHERWGEVIRELGIKIDP